MVGRVADWRTIYRVHPSSKVFPSLPADDPDKLTDDIRKHGLRQPIKLWRDADGAIWLIDGRSRADALQKLGQSVEAHAEFVKCDANELPNLIVSLNIHRRHLEAADRVRLAYAALKAADAFAPAAPVRGGHKRGRRKGIVAQVASAAKVSRQTAYVHVRKIAPHVVPTAKTVHQRIQAALDHAEQLPPSPPRRGSNHNPNGHGGGRSRTLQRRVADHVGVALGTVQRHIATFGEGVSGRRCPDTLEHDAVKDDEENIVHLRRALHELEKVDGTGLREDNNLQGVGALLLKQVQRAVARITMECTTGEVSKAEGSSLRPLPARA